MRKTIKNVNGWDVQISTGKNYKNIISCTAQFGVCEERSGYQTFSHALFSDPSLTLAQAKPGERATEKKLLEVFNAGLAEFERLKEANELPIKKDALEIQVGQILFLNGYGQDEQGHERLAVYEIEGSRYKTVNLETLTLSTEEHIRPIEEKFGIGIYYKKGDVIEVNEVKAAVAAARVKVELKEKADKEQREAAQIERSEKIKKGAEIINAIPEGVSHAIVANLMEDDSDIQSDYFASHSTQTVFLAFSKHGRDLFDEMRKAAANCPIEEINKYSVKPEKPEGENEFWTPEDEHREKYSMGSGYYLGSQYRSGWEISKTNIDGRSLEALQIAAAEGRYFIPEQSEQTEVKNYSPVEVKAGTVQIIDYSEKAIAVIGDTKPIKDKLKELGGRFNFRLSCGAGWIFPKTKLTELQSALV
jgi:hypothetical protein